MNSLYDIAAEYREIAEKLNDSDFDEQTIADTLEGMSGDLVQKCTNVGFFIRNMEAESEAMKAAEESIAKRRATRDSKIKRMKDYLLNAMISTGKTKIESPWFVLSVRNNQESVVVDADSQIPEGFMRMIPAKYEPDKVLIKKAIQSGIEVEGCHLARSQSLQIK
ncbi:Phage protein [Candidatus Propionivibrio aalborgensis]|uniref:Phage protein n=1 Tax=Candidatus Propionivibrio aalborgensis TaxID=1860101 RepID=A0A1A8Y0W1_9RHOO|nr:siphovirus Gp157 family protein [Candidatus Propionivibrio aalborgensis]MBL0108914.1 siphovirus Gp157 family protein [Ignavibacteria bacterium]SBT10642.1 Phage protein [Candidatus Propionivibrio aalborgensis]